MERDAGPRLGALGGLRTARLALEPQDGGQGYRHRLADLVDEALSQHYHRESERLGISSSAGVALAAVGSQGRRDAGPTSDLDLMLVHDGRTHPPERIGELAEALWYPLWDAGLDLDHSVRSLAQCRSIASADLPAAVGLIEVRPVCGDESVVQQARSAVLQDWRSAARRRLPDLVDSIRARADRHGELAHLSEPDVKQARGGLRDAVVLRALAATWLADRPHGPVDEAWTTLLDARDALCRITTRPATRLLRVHQQEVATALGLADADELLARLAGAGRLISASLDATVRDARQALRRPSAVLGARIVRGRWRPARLPQVADGVIEHDGELVLDADARPSSDPVLSLRAAAAAARTGLRLAPSTVASLANTPSPSPPWPTQARDDLLQLLRSGAAQLQVWESLDLADVVTTWLPEWAAVRGRAQRSPVHVFTVDRHLVQTVVHACRAPRDLPERDVLLWAGLLHDIGKVGGDGDHSEVGARIAGDIVERIGLERSEQERIVTLVRHHLVLAEAADGADIDDPGVIATLAGLLDHDPITVVLLRHLSEADARATGPAVWTPWRGRRMDRLTTRLLDHLTG